MRSEMEYFNPILRGGTEAVQDIAFRKMLLEIKCLLCGEDTTWFTDGLQDISTVSQRSPFSFESNKNMASCQLFRP